MRTEYTSNSQGIGHNVRGAETASVMIFSKPIKVKETSCGFFQKLFHGEDIAEVNQYLHVRFSNGDFINEPSKIVEIRESQPNCLLFIMENDSRYAVIFSKEDNRAMLHNVYANAVVCDEKYISGSIKYLPCFSTLKAICEM